MHSHPNYYSVIPAPVRNDETLSSTVKLLYAEISALTHEQGYCWASNRFLAGRFRVTLRAISKWIGVLQQRGHLRVEIEDRNRRKIWITHPGTGVPSPTNTGSIPQERPFHPHRIYTKNNTRESHTTRDPSDLSAQRFIKLWDQAYRERFRVPYKTSVRKDAAAACELCDLDGYTPENLMTLARSAWAHLDRFNCKHAVSINGFAARFNQIRAETGTLRKPSTGF